MMRQPTLFLLIALLAVLPWIAPGCGDEDGTGPVDGGPIVVTPDGTGDYATIQEAINAASPGDTIALTTGTFAGDGNRDLEYFGKAITIMSQSGDPETCVIDCGGSETEPHRGFYFHRQEGEQSVLMGVKVMNGLASSGGAVICTDVSSPTITNCIFSNNEGTEAGGGMHIHDQSSPTVSSCVFAANTTGGNGGGIYISESSPTFEGCTIVGNTAAAQAGGVAIFNSGSEFTNCTISGNSPDGIVCGEAGPVLQNTIVAFSVAGEGVSCAGGCDIVLNCSDVYGNAGGDSTACIVGQFGVRGNLCADPLFCNPQTGDFHLRPESPCSAESSYCGRIGAWPVGCE